MNARTRRTITFALAIVLATTAMLALCTSAFGHTDTGADGGLGWLSFTKKVAWIGGSGSSGHMKLVIQRGYDSDSGAWVHLWTRTYEASNKNTIFKCESKPDASLNQVAKKVSAKKFYTLARKWPVVERVTWAWKRHSSNKKYRFVQSITINPWVG